MLSVAVALFFRDPSRLSYGGRGSQDLGVYEDFMNVSEHATMCVWGGVGGGALEGTGGQRPAIHAARAL